MAMRTFSSLSAEDSTCAHGGKVLWHEASWFLLAKGRTARVWRGSTMVMRAFLFRSRRALCASRAAPRPMLDTTSPLTSTKSPLMTSLMSISLSASPAVLQAVLTITCNGVAAFHDRFC